MVQKISLTSVKRGKKVRPLALTICTKISVENFRQMVLVFLWHRKQERDWVVPLTKYRQSFRFLWAWSLALVIQTNGTTNFGRFSKNGLKGNTSKGITFFPENFHRDEPFHLNSLRNFWVFHTNGKRSRLIKCFFFLHSLSHVVAAAVVSFLNTLSWHRLTEPSWLIFPKFCLYLVKKGYMQFFTKL